jgi:hypothetical protein
MAVAARMAKGLPRWAEAIPGDAIGSIAMCWVIERVAAFALRPGGVVETAAWIAPALLGHR